MQFSLDNTLLKKSLQFIPIAILVYIIWDLVNNESVFFSLDFLQNQIWSWNRVVLIIPVLILMLINWFFESKKWQLLTKNYHQLSLKKAYFSVLSGVSTALFTPNRIGDFIGRISHLPKSHRKKGIVSSFYGSFSQWLLTIIMGWLAWIQLGEQFVDSSVVYFLISISYFIAIVTLLILYHGKGIKIKALSKWKKYFLNPPSTLVRNKLIVYSFLRYLVFTAQFYLLLRFLGIELDYGLVMSKLGLLYLLTALLPATFWGELGIKESIAVWVFSGIIVNSLIVICATLLLWFINLLIPALIGNYLLFKEARVSA